jgi:RNA polymerase sigma factor (sigma-70 family)
MTNGLLDPPPDDAAAGALTGDRRRSARPAPVDVSTVEFELFYRAETRDLVRFLIWLGASLADAADVAQDTMIEAFHRWPTIRTPRAWVRRVASRIFLRRLARVVERPVDDVDARPLLAANRDLTDWEQHDEICHLLAQLPPRQRQVMAWTFDGYPPRQIAAELGITADAVRSNLKLARRALAERLSTDGGTR